MSVASKTGRVASRTTKRAVTRTGRAGWKMALATTLGCLFGWWGDRPRNVNQDPSLESALETRAQTASAVFWPIFAVWLAAGAPNAPHLLVWLAETTTVDRYPMLAWQVLISIFACIVLMRRVMAAAGHAWYFRSMWRSTRHWVDVDHWVHLPLLFSCVAMPAWWATGDRTETDLGHTLPVVTLLAVAVFVSMREVSWRRKSDRWLPDVRASLDVAEQVMASTNLLPRKGDRGFLHRKREDGFTIARPHADVVKRVDGILARVATHLPRFEPAVHQNDLGEVTSVEFKPVTPRERSRRHHMKESGDLVEQIDLREDGTAAVTLHADVRDSRVDDVAHYLAANGFGTLTYFNRHEHRAIAKHLDAVTLSTRNGLALTLSCAQQEVEVVVSEVNDADTGERRIDVIEITRHPLGDHPPAERLVRWQQFVLGVPGGSLGWTITDDGPVTFTWGKKPALPKKVLPETMVPPGVPVKSWGRLPIGVTAHHQVESLDLELSPHTLVVGRSGTGKSVMLTQIALSALLRGWEVVLIEAIKGGVDFEEIDPWLSARSDDTVAGAYATLEAVYAEGVKRKEILKKHKAKKRTALPESLQFPPLMVIFDEVMSALKPGDLPKNPDKESPRYKKLVELNNHKSGALMLLGDVAREMRFVNIHLVCATQRQDANLLPGFGEIRNNLGNVVLLALPHNVIPLETLRMSFAGEQAGTADAVIRELDDGLPGLAVTAAESGGVSGFRVPYADPEKGEMQVDELLRDLRVPEARKWQIAGAPRPEPEPVEGEVIAGTERGGDEVIELGEFEFTIEDLDSTLIETVVDDDPFAPNTPPKAAISDDLFA